jgi:hypothetical protein
LPPFSTDALACNEGFEREMRKDFKEEFLWQVVDVHGTWKRKVEEEGGRGT